MGDKITKIIMWNKPYKEASIWARDDHTGYVLFFNKNRIGNYEKLDEAIKKMNEMIGYA